MNKKGNKETKKDEDIIAKLKKSFLSKEYIKENVISFLLMFITVPLYFKIMEIFSNTFLQDFIIIVLFGISLFCLYHSVMCAKERKTRIIFKALSSMVFVFALALCVLYFASTSGFSGGGGSKQKAKEAKEKYDQASLRKANYAKQGLYKDVAHQQHLMDKALSEMIVNSEKK